MRESADGSYDVYDEVPRRARKGHICAACGIAILKGHYYTSVHTVFDGTAETIKRCGSCQLMHEHLRKLCWKVEGVWPDERLGCGLDYEEEWGNEPPLEIQALAFANDDERGQLVGPIGRLKQWASDEACEKRMNRLSCYRYPCVLCERQPAIASDSWIQLDKHRTWCWRDVDGMCDARHMKRAG